MLVSVKNAMLIHLKLNSNYSWKNFLFIGFCRYLSSLFPYFFSVFQAFSSKLAYIFFTGG